MSQVTSKVSEFRRFPFWGTLLGGIFLLILIRVYWDPALVTTVVKSDKKEIWENTHYAVWGPIWKYGFSRIGKGEIPHWNPYQLCGQPYLADIRTALFQPLHLLFWRMEFAHAYQWYIFLSLSLLGIGFLIWGRILEIPYPALIPGLVSLLFSGPVICAQMTLPLFSASVWLLFLLSGLVYFMENPTVRNSLVLLFIWTALVLSGSIECILTGILLFILCPLVFLGFPMLNIKKISFPIILKISGIFMLGILISSFTWFPFVLWLIYSGEGIEQFISFPLSAHFPETLYMSLSQILTPILLRDISELPTLYPGLICIIFMIPAFFDRELRFVALFHGLILLFFLLLFFINVEFVQILQKGMLILVAVSISTLSGIGFQRLLLKGRDLSSPYVWVSGVLVFLLLTFFIVVGNPWIKGISILLLVLLVPAVILRITKINSILCILIALLSFIELYYLLRPFLPENYTSSIEKKDAFSECIRQLRYQTGTGRGLILSRPNSILWSDNLGMYYHWQLVNGKSLPVNKFSRIWIDSLLNHEKGTSELFTNPLLTNSGVQWVFITDMEKNHANEKRLKNWRKMEQIPFVEIYENTQPLPRCFWTPDYKMVSSLEESINILLNNDTFSFKHCIVYSDTPDIMKVPDSTEPSLEGKEEIIRNILPATIQEEKPEYISIQVKAPREGFLVLLDTFSPGWDAFVDGEQMQIFPTNGIFKGLPLPGGVHQVIFKYSIPGWDTGKIITLISLLFTLIFLFIGINYSNKKTI